MRMKNRRSFVSLCFRFFFFSISLRILSRKWNVKEVAIYKSFLCIWIGAFTFGKNLKHVL